MRPKVGCPVGSCERSGREKEEESGCGSRSLNLPL